jgi:putative inorganic carbon (hco3(-)) transporter
MRDLLIAAIVFGTLPFVFSRPWLGIILWSWISYMNPHRLAFGFAFNFPWALLIAVFTLAAVVTSRHKQAIPWTRETKILVAFNLWMFATTFFALDPTSAWETWNKVVKIQLMTFVTMMLINDSKKLKWLIWSIVVSLGFFGVKGGIFTLLTAGSFRVWGPPGSYIEGNNEVALALIVIAPLIWFLHMQEANKWIKRGLFLAMVLTMIAAIGSQSRGALLAIGAMGFFLWLKSRGKIVTGAYGVIFIVLLAAFLPQSWYDRMNTIRDYKSDESAMGRINAWHVGFNIAKDRLTGGGFNTFNEQTFAIYAPDPDAVHDVHSIYFEVLGEHGFLGLILFLALWIFTWFTASGVIRRCKGRRDLQWAADLSAMCQVSLIGYGAGGAFLGLAYFDLPYHILTMVILVSRFSLAQQGEAKSTVAILTSTEAQPRIRS